MIGIIGRLGAGKSTLLRVINRLTDATSGAIYGDQELLSFRGIDKRAWQARCAMIFQQFNLVPRMDVVSNVLFGTLNARSTFASLLNLFSQSDINRTIDILERLGVAENCTKRAEALSGGNGRMVTCARRSLISGAFRLRISLLDMTASVLVVMDTQDHSVADEMRGAILNRRTIKQDIY